MAKKTKTVIDPSIRQFKAGIGKRPVPRGASALENIGLHNLSRVTLTNLKRLEAWYDIEWKSVHKYTIKRETSQKEAYGYFIYGELKNCANPEYRFVTYSRRETTSAMAGQSYIYFLNGLRIPVCFLKGENTSNTRLPLERVFAWLGLVSPLNRFNGLELSYDHNNEPWAYKLNWKVK